MGFWVLFGFVVVQRLVELVIARRNERWIKTQGGYEVGAAHYQWIVAVHVLFFISLVIEVVFFGAHPAWWWPFPFAFFVLAQGLRFWALLALGRYWNTKILVLPGAHVVSKGPYRLMRHPNYLIVATEILMLPLVFQAYVTAAVFTLANIGMMAVRIPTEERALAEVTNYQTSTGKRPRFFP